MKEHTVTSFESELFRLGFEIARMGGLAREQFENALGTLTHPNPEAAARLVAEDAAIDQLEREVQQAAVLLLARRAPVAADLREVVAAIKISTDLERVGDLAKGMAKREWAAQTAGDGKPIRHLARMGELALGLLEEVLTAYAERDAGRALEAWRGDQAVDDQYHRLFEELLALVADDPATAGVYTQLLVVAKTIERVGDHCANIAEAVYFLVTGEPPPEARPKGGDTSHTGVPSR